MTFLTAYQASFKSLVLAFILLSSQLNAISQPKSTQLIFSSPLEIPLYLAGSFAELRSNHLHSGLDIKTQGREGLKVLSVADGYVSRIKISEYGYGRAIYIRHANGYTSVYAHLQKFNDEIEEYVRDYQYKSKSFKVEIYPAANLFPLKSGDLIAYSGNSGSSAAPHLHFELRETKTEAPVNPLLYGFDIKDDISPELLALYIYPRGVHSTVNGNITKQKIKLIKEDGVFKIPVNKEISAYGRVGLGLEMFDQLNEVPNKCGVYEIELYRNEDLIYHHLLDKFKFSETRYLNALVDYEEKMKNKTWIYHTFKLPNNKLSIFPTDVGNGVFSVPENQIDHFKYFIKDTYGNTSIMKFEITGAGPDTKKQGVIGQKPVRQFKYNQANSFEQGDVMIYLPANILYDDLDFNFWVDDTLANCFSPLYHIHDIYTPLQSYMALSIKLQSMEPSLRKYATIVSQDDKEGFVPEGGYWKGDYLIVKTRSFGAYTVMIDSVKPTLTPVNIPDNKDMSRKWSILIKAEDNLSGVEKYDAYIDGNWVLLEFDYKKKLLIHRFEDNLSKGPHVFNLTVKDKIGNESKLEVEFNR
jgi:hypothetical protein